MALTDPVLSGPKSGRTVTYAAAPKGLSHGLEVRGDAARLLVTLVPAGAEYFFVPRDESDADPAKFGLQIQGEAPRE